MPLLLTDDLKKRLYAHHQYDESKYDIEATGEETYRFVPKAQPSFQPPAPDETTAELGAANLKPTGPSNLESFGRAAATSVIPTAAGVGGAMAGAGLAAMMVPEPVVSKIVGAGLLGLAGSFAGSKLQEAVVPQSIQEKLFTRPIDIQENPIPTAIGNLVPTAATLRPSLDDIKTLGQGVRNLSWLAQGSRGALTPEQVAALANAGVGLGIAGGMEAQALSEGKPFNPLESAINVLPGALFTRPTALGTKLGFGNTEVTKAPVIPDEPAPSKPVVPQTKETPNVSTEQGVVISEGQVAPLGTIRRKGEASVVYTDKEGQKAKYVIDKGTPVGTPENPDSTQLGGDFGVAKPMRSAADSAEVFKTTDIAEQKKIDYKTALREKAKQDAEEAYQQAFEEAAQGKLLPSKVATAPEIRPTSKVQTYLGKEEPFAKANKEIAEAPKTEAEWAQEQFDRLEEQDRLKYQADQEGEALAQQEKLLADIEAEATRRQLKVRYVPEIKVAGQSKRGYYDPKTREVVISKSRATTDTPSHEVGHGYVDDLLASSNTKDHDFVLRGLEFADEQGRKFRTKKDWEALTPEERTTIDERFVQLLGEEGAKQRKAELYGTKRQQFSKWLENVGSNVKNKLGIGDPTDRARSVAVSQRHDLRQLKPTEEVGQVAPAPKYQESDKSDYEQYQEVQRKFKELMLQGKGMGDPEIQALWKENEVIKNRHGGMPPKAPEGGDKKFQDDDQTSTPEFKAWFGDSKVVDKDGKPLRVYHGTGADFTKFKGRGGEYGWFTSIPKKASRYADQEGGNIKPVFLSIKNPAPMSAFNRNRVNELKAMGYDGVIGEREDGHLTAFTFSPEQIKSATGNSGAFDPNNPDIRYQADDESAFIPESLKLIKSPSYLAFSPEAKKLNALTFRKRLEQKVPKEELDMLDSLGFKDFVKSQEGYVDLKEAAKWIEDNAPKTQVHSYGMEGKVSISAKIIADFEHEMDTKGWKIKQVDGGNFVNPLDNKQYDIVNRQGRLVSYSDSFMSKVDNYWRAKRNEPVYDTNSPHATTAYETVSAFNTHEPMPEWTKSKEGRNVQRVDVVIPPKPGYQSKAEQMSGDNWKTKEQTGVIWQPDNLHENLPNTLGWAMIQYKTGPKGEKIAVIVEAQSRWGQHVRETIKKSKEDFGLQQGQTDPIIEASEKRIGHPLLSDYNRLILKAAIDQARKEGATHIVVSDAKTAMMSEGHDLATTADHDFASTRIAAERRAQQLRDQGYRNVTVEKSPGGGDWSIRFEEAKPTQEPGMRLNYDKILPDMAKALTGYEGEMVSLGEHKNAMSLQQDYHPSNPWETINTRVPRSNLIFKNPDGTPKTDVSGVMFPIDKIAARQETGEKMSMFGRRYQPDNEKTTNEPLLLHSRFDKVARLGETGKEVSEKLKNFQSESEFLQGKFGNKVIAALKGYDESEIANVYKYRHAVSNGLPTDGMSLSAKEQKLKSALDKEFKAIGEDIIKSGVEVKDSEDFRKMQLKPEGYQPNIIAQKVINAWQENTADAPKYDKLYTDHLERQGLTAEEATAQLKEYKQAVGNAGVTPDIRFNAIRKAEGLGLPFELVEQNPALAFRRYGRRAANDVAYFKYLQNDPRMLKALGIRDQYGKDFESYPDDVKNKAKDVTWIGGSEEVKNALRSVYGIDTPMNPKGNAAIRAIANSVIQTGAAIRNIVGLPTSYASYYGVTPKTLVEAFTKMSERSTRAFESNAVRSSFKDFDAAGVIEGNPDRFVDLADKYSNFMRKYTLRDFSDKFEGELSYSLGETLATNWFAQAKAGDIKARRMLNRFGGNIEGGVKEKFLPKSEVTGEDISRVAKNFVDATRGSYGPSGLPSSAIEGGAAPMLSLSRWSIEKFNTFQKDVVRPITDHGDWMPLLKTTFAGLLTGAAIEQLNELLTQKKGADATIEETWADGDIDAITHKVIGLLQLGGFAGILSDTMKASSAWSQGKDLAFSNPISMPALTLAEELFQNSGYAFEAAQQGEDKLEVLSKFLGDLLKSTYQNVRYASNLANKEETERKSKFRDLRVFRELEGKPPGDASAGNPYLGMAAREFKRAEDLETAASKLPRALETAVKKSKGNYEDLVGNVEGLRKNSYQTFPADPLEASKYYQYLVKTIGVDRANMRYADYLKQQEVNKQKTKMVPKLKSMFSKD